MLMKPDPGAIDALVQAALLEDAPWGDLTCQVFFTTAASLRAQLVAREPGVLCGEDIFTAAMRLTDTTIQTNFLVHDGDHFKQNAVLAEVEGSAPSVLQAERVALNFTQRLSGIATMTAAYVAETTGTTARIVDTRKTTPGLRLLERYAVRCGGGHNHRFSLSDAVMVKDNHLAALNTATAEQQSFNLTRRLREAHARIPHTTHFEVEIDRLDQIEPVLAAGVDTIMLDNFTTDDMRAAVQQIGKRALIEASGGITLARIREIAATGVNIISVGALTHSVCALDLGLDMSSSRPHHTA